MKPGSVCQRWFGARTIPVIGHGPLDPGHLLSLTAAADRRSLSHMLDDLDG